MFVTPTKIKKRTKVADNYPNALEFLPEFFMTQKVCDKAFKTYPSTIKFVPECFITQEMCDKTVNKCFCNCFYF